MKKIVVLTCAIGLAGCGDFVDDEGNTSIRQFAEGLQSLGDRLTEFGEAIERDADIEAVPWADLTETLPRRVDGLRRTDAEGDEATDRNGAGMSIVHGHYVEGRDSLFVGVADLGAFRGGVDLILRWVTPLFGGDDMDGEIEEIEFDGRPGIRIRDDDGDVLIAVIAYERFAVIAGAGARHGGEAWVREALNGVDYGRLEDLANYGMR